MFRSKKLYSGIHNITNDICNNNQSYKFLFNFNQLSFNCRVVQKNIYMCICMYIYIYIVLHINL